MSTKRIGAGLTVEVLPNGEVVHRGKKRDLIAAGIVSEAWFPVTGHVQRVAIDDDGHGSRIDHSQFQRIMKAAKTVSIHRAGRFGFEVWVRTPAGTSGATRGRAIESVRGSSPIGGWTITPITGSPSHPTFGWSDDWHEASGLEREWSAEFDNEFLAWRSLLHAKRFIQRSGNRAEAVAEITGALTRLVRSEGAFE
jgi:hypothetical protein